MAVKDIVSFGFGYNQVSIKFIPTIGFDSKVLTQSTGGQSVSLWIWDLWDYQRIKND